MEVRLLWVYQSFRKGLQAPVEGGQRPTLCFKGHTNMLGLSVGYPVRVIKRPVRDFDTLRIVMNGTKEPYKIEHAVEKLRVIATRNGITQGASKLLDRALLAAAEIDEEQFNDEEELIVETTQQQTESKGNGSAITQEAKDMTTKKKTKRTPKEKPIKAVKAAKAEKRAKSVKVRVIKVSKNPKLAKPEKTAKPKGEKRERLDYETQVLPFIVKAFKMIKEPHTPKDRPRGFASGLYVAMMDKFGVTRNTADQYYWKAVWNYPKNLGIKK